MHELNGQFLKQKSSGEIHYSAARFAHAASPEPAYRCAVGWGMKNQSW